MNETEKLLRAALFALNSIPNHKLENPDFKDTYSLAKEISQALRNYGGPTSPTALGVVGTLDR